MKKKWDTLTFAFFFVTLIAPYIANIMCAIPAADDFWMMGNSNSLCGNAFSTANFYWYNWSGEWFLCLVQVLFNPLRLAGYSSNLINIELVLLFLLLVSTIIYCTHLILTELLNFHNSKMEKVIWILTVALVLNSGTYQEIYTWYVGASYMLEITLALASVALIIKYYKTNATVYAWMISIIGFFSCMGIMVVSSICLVYLFLFLPSYFRKKKHICTLIPFTFCLAGGLFAVLAPGNYVRHSGIDSSGLHFTKALIQALNFEATYVYRLFSNVLLGVLLFGILLISFFYARKHNKEVKSINISLSLLCYAVTMLTVIFPVMLGYSETVNLPNRIEFMIYTYSLLGMCILFFNMGIRLGCRFSEPVDSRIIRSLVFETIICIYIGVSGRGYIGKLPYYRQIAYYSDSVRCHNEWIDIYNEIAESKDENVVIYRDKYSYCNNIMNAGMEYESDGCVNVSMAKYFNKKSIRIDIAQK